MRWRVVTLTVLMASCAGLDMEQSTRLRIECPEHEVIARHVMYPIPGVGVLVCNHVRVLSGPYRHTVYLECQPPRGLP